LQNLSKRTCELGTPDSWVLGKFDFDIFGTLTWATVPPLSVQEKCTAEFTRRVAKKIYNVSSTLDYLWAYRYEIGEKTGRPHWHVLMGAHRTTSTKNKTTLSHQIKHIWEKEVKATKSKKYKPCVGFADIRKYDSNKAGADYICKPALSARDFYELNKFHDGFKMADGCDATRVSLGPRLVLEIAKRRSHKFPGFARFLRAWKQRNLNPKRVSHSTKKYRILPNQDAFSHPADDTTVRLYC